MPLKCSGTAQTGKSQHLLSKNCKKKPTFSYSSKWHPTFVTSIRNDKFNIICLAVDDLYSFICTWNSQTNNEKVQTWQAGKVKQVIVLYMLLFCLLTVLATAEETDDFVQFPSFHLNKLIYLTISRPQFFLFDKMIKTSFCNTGSRIYSKTFFYLTFWLEIAFGRVILWYFKLWQVDKVLHTSYRKS